MKGALVALILGLGITAEVRLYLGRQRLRRPWGGFAKARDVAQAIEADAGKFGVIRAAPRVDVSRLGADLHPAATPADGNVPPHETITLIQPQVPVRLTLANSADLAVDNAGGLFH